MTRSLSEVQQEHRQQQIIALEKELDKMQPLLKKMHLLSSNAVSSAARAGTEGDAFRVLTQAIQQLGQDINSDVQQAHFALNQLRNGLDDAAQKPLLRQLDNALSALPTAIRKGDYLAICSSVEAAHTETHGPSFDSVASMLKQLINTLRQQVVQQQDALSKLQALM
ncbi:hypothetical protein [Methylophaga sp.]|uniref:hypothetical protein n=1 Tax=Methylophaga sp. TaxID=2024840 RepID=UPI003F69C183